MCPRVLGVLFVACCTVDTHCCCSNMTIGQHLAFTVVGAHAGGCGPPCPWFYCPDSLCTARQLRDSKALETSGKVVRVVLEVPGN